MGAGGSVFTGDDFTSSFFIFLAGGGPVGVWGGVAGRLGTIALIADAASEELPPDSVRFGEYKSST